MIAPLLLWACAAPPPPADALGWRASGVEITLPAPEALAAGPLPIGPCAEASAAAETTTWRCDPPHRGLRWGPSRREPPPGLRLLRAGAALRFLPPRTERPAAPSWTLREGAFELVLHRGEPAPTDVLVDYPPAFAAETRLRPARAEDALGPILLGDEAAQALILPAGGAATFALTPTAGARFRATVHLPPGPLAAAAPSDGAALHLSTEQGPFATLPLTEEPQDLDLPLPAGAATLSITVASTGSPHLDRALLRAPRVLVPREHPRRLLFVFIDTLRADRLSCYGHSRPTPNIDALAASGLRFAQARAVAPWTLPSTRALLTGRLPDRFEPDRSLFVDLARAGFTTVGHVANAWLTTPLGLTAGFAAHRHRGDASATDQVAAALLSLQTHADEDLALFVHLMDVHLPHREPEPFASRYVGDVPAELRRPYNGATLRALPIDPRRKSVVRQHLLDRYDQSLAYVDDALGPLLQSVGDDATIVLFGDHGEELWEHGGVEHGHSLYDELLHVPLILRSPGLPAQVRDEPVSLLDLAPTLRALLDLPADPESDGRSLLPLLDGATLPARDLALGWTLYGQSAWGLLSGTEKWMTQGRHHARYDLSSDPAEKLNLGVDPADPAWPTRLAAALGRPVDRVLRLTPPGVIDGSSLPEATLRLRHPAGLGAFWPRTDWIGRATPPVVEPDGALRVRRDLGGRLPSEVFVEAPQGTGLRLSIEVGGQTWQTEVGALPATAGPRGQAVALDQVWAPRPAPDTSAAALDPLIQAQLTALGYAEP